MSLLDNRLESAFGRKYTADEVWNRLFTDNVAGQTARSFIASTVVIRPRDVIYFARQAVSDALNRGNSMVTEQDLLSARDKYSEHAFKTVVAEDDPRRGKLETVLFEFSGARRILNRSDVEARIRAANVDAMDSEFYFDLLCDLNFLGIETSGGFEFPRDEDHRRIIRETARKIAWQSERREESYKINEAFRQVLQIS